MSTSGHLNPPQMVGAFYKNGRKLGDVLNAVQLSAPEVKPADQVKPSATKERFQLTVSGSLLMGALGDGKNIYEVASKASRLRVYPQSCQAAKTMTKILVDLAP